jgi:hypothetical protein
MSCDVNNYRPTQAASSLPLPLFDMTNSYLFLSSLNLMIYKRFWTVTAKISAVSSAERRPVKPSTTPMSLAFVGQQSVDTPRTDGDEVLDASTRKVRLQQKPTWSITPQPCALDGVTLCVVLGK